MCIIATGILFLCTLEAFKPIQNPGSTNENRHVNVDTTKKASHSNNIKGHEQFSADEMNKTLIAEDNGIMLLRLSTPDINRTPPNVVLHSPPQNDDVNEESESSDYLEDNESRDDSPSNESSEDFQGKKENYSKSKKLSYPIALKRTSRSFFSHTKWIKVNSGQMQNGKSINTPMQNIPEEFKYFVAPENSNEALYFYSEDSGHTEILNSENNINNNSKEESVISSNSWKEEQDDDDVSRYYTPPLFYTNSQGIVNN